MSTDWPEVWVCECQREYPGPGQCTAYHGGSKRLYPYTIPPRIYEAAEELQKCAGILQLAAPPDAVTAAVDRLAKFAWYDDAPHNLAFVREGGPVMPFNLARRSG